MTEFTAKPWRHERKFRISPVQHAAATRWCRQALAPDPHAGPDGRYFIRSLYLDSLENGDYLDKAVEAPERKKIRVRVYSEQPDFAVLERKHKVGMWNQKERLSLALDEAAALLRGEADFLLGRATDAAVRFYAEIQSGLYRPVVGVEYEREAYLLPFEDIRITFDHAVRYTLADFALTGRKSLIPLFADGSVVLEVKYNEEFPRWAAARLGAVDEVQIALSKFGLALAPWRPAV